jgi:hypothetical protein
LAVLVAALLFVAALVTWLAELMGTLIIPCLLVGLLFALLAIIIYKVTLRQTIRETEEQLGLVYDVAKVVNVALKRVASVLDALLGR